MTEQQIFQSFRDQLSHNQMPTRLQGYDQTISSHPQPTSAQMGDGGKTSHPVQVSQLDERDWESWNQAAATHASAEQLERLQQWLKPLPTALIQLRQLLQTQQTAINHLNGVSNKLMEIYQQELTAPATQPTTSLKPKMTPSWSAIADRCMTPLVALIVTVALLHIGLQPLNQKLDRVINRVSQLEKLLGEHNGR